ncbi:hypothetical protein PILCRDRAFT_725421 [Piloderma croceum F 1598]|uniref:Uncharacterized protein n=1 Tax=Piloderma croceum (strain F 1598) TaxID=765440 RepID=A0A0C3ELU8_PILCF|nr:hypothetical protein PILCRDRAFT_725421 [Piloderma croceum F 1598]
MHHVLEFFREVIQTGGIVVPEVLGQLGKVSNLDDYTKKPPVLQMFYQWMLSRASSPKCRLRHCSNLQISSTFLHDERLVLQPNYTFLNLVTSAVGFTSLSL